jgi:hypothetical protein
VTDLAGDLTLSAMIKREGVIAQESRRPGSHSVAILTFYAEETSVDGRLGMALDALSRQVAENTFQVAFAAGELGMACIEHKECRMIKVFHPVPAVMTFQAGGAELLDVGLHEDRIMLAMAAGTGIQINL